MKSIFSRKSASGASTWPSSMPRPLPRAHHSLLWKPLPEKSTARRTGASLGRDRLSASSPQTRSDSIHGSAIAHAEPHAGMCGGKSSARSSIASRSGKSPSLAP